MNLPGLAAGFTFARIRGIPIKANISLLIVGFALVMPAVAEPTADRLGGVLGAVLLMGLFFFTILLHELGHAFVALNEEMTIHGITLWALGGIAHITGGRGEAGAHFRVAAAGPAVTGILALLLTAAGSAMGGRIGGALEFPTTTAGFVMRIARMQVFLLALNLIPAHPLDGGRMLHAALWAGRKNLTWANKVTSAVGKGFGILLIALAAIPFALPGISQMLPNAFRFSGLFGFLLGYMIYSSARHPAVVPTPPRPEGTVVLDFMVRNFLICAPELSVADLVEGFRKKPDRPAALVVSDGVPLGMLSRQGAQAVPEDQRGKKVDDVMVPRAEIRVLDATDTLETAKKAVESGPDTAFVLQNDVVVGLVRVSDVARASINEQ